jgi:hypothetical protein
MRSSLLLLLAAVAFASGCAAAPPRPETTLAGAVSALEQRIGELEQARLEVVRARRRNLEALQRNTAQTRAETQIILGAWRLSSQADRLALQEGVLGAASDLPPAAIPGAAPATSDGLLEAQETPSEAASVGGERARLSASAQSLALLGAQRAVLDQVGAYVRYLKSVRLEVKAIEQRARASAKDAAASASGGALGR